MTKTVLQLNEPTIFPELNRKEGHAPDFARENLELSALKYKHFREIVKFPEVDQMHHLMLQLTGLTDKDLGELSPKDAAQISEIVFESMKEYIELGQKMMQGMDIPKR